MTRTIPVNPAVLRWARESLGMSVEDVASGLNKRVSEIEAWERGDTSPTYVQLETLAYRFYRRPVAMFFFPDPPEEENIVQSFRTLPENEMLRLSSRMRYLLRKARVMQLNLFELYDGINPAETNIVGDLNFTSDVDVVDMASRVRAYMGLDRQPQQRWTRVDDALKYWRNVLEAFSIFVFKDSFNKSGSKEPNVNDIPYSGFCLYDATFPVIYVNNNEAKTRQIFTLFHELAHLLFHTSGVDKRQDDFVEHLSGAEKRIEILCNQFAAEFLVPHQDFEKRVAHRNISDQLVSELAGVYCVSREVILRRFLDRRQLSQTYYDEKVRQWRAESESRGGSGGNYYPTKGTYLGERYVERVFSRYHQNRITLEQAADYLGAKTKSVPGMEEWLFGQDATA